MKIIFEDNLTDDSVRDVDELDYFTGLDFNESHEKSLKIAPRRQIDLLLENKRLMSSIKEIYDL